MSSEHSPLALLPFVPASDKDFKRYAKNLAVLLQVRYQRAQQLLAKVYGYSSYHQLRQTLESASHLPGPFHTDVLATGGDDVSRLGYLSDQLTAREDRALAVLRSESSEYDDDPTISQALNDAAHSIGLFEKPSTHQRLFSRIYQKYPQLRSGEFPDVPLPATAYATLSINDERRVDLSFTELGRSIIESVNVLLPSDESFASDNAFEKCVAGLTALSNRHPNNPWVSAVLIIEMSKRYYQTTWADYVHGRSQFSESFLHIEPIAASAAEDFLEEVAECISTFEALYEGKGRKAVTYRYYENHSEFGGDQFYWSAILFYGSIIAANAGDLNRAYSWMLSHYTINKRSDGFGSRYYLAAFRLVRGKGSIRQLFPLRSPDASPWSNLSLAAEAYIKQRPIEAARFFAQTVFHCYQVAVYFLGEIPRLDGAYIGSNSRSLASVEEYFYRTEPFWLLHPDAQAFFVDLLDTQSIDLLVERKELIAARQARQRVGGPDLSIDLSNIERRLIDHMTDKVV